MQGNFQLEIAVVTTVVVESFFVTTVVYLNTEMILEILHSLYVIYVQVLESHTVVILLSSKLTIKT